MRVAHVLAHVYAVLSRLENVGVGESAIPAVVVGRNRFDIKLKVEDLLLARCKYPCFLEGDKFSCGLTKLTAGRGGVHLYYLSSAVCSRISHRNRQGDPISVSLLLCEEQLALKCGIAQAVAEGIDYPIGREGLEVTVSDEDVLSVDIFLVPTEAFRRGIVLNGSDGIGESAAGASVPRQGVHRSSTALLSPCHA